MQSFLSYFTQQSDGLSLPRILIAVAASIILGLIISLTYMITQKKKVYSQNFIYTIIMLPAIICIVITMVGSNVARAFSLAGAVSIIRFRSAPGDPKDIMYIFFALAAGLTCGIGYIIYAVILTLMLCLVMILLDKVNFGAAKGAAKLLKISIPDTLDYKDIFDDIFKKYTKEYELIKVKTTNLGTLLELAYSVTIPNDADEKQFIDELRSRNGNLNIVLAHDTDSAWE